MKKSILSRALSLFLCVVMLCGMVPAIAITSSATEVGGVLINTKGNTTVKYVVSFYGENNAELGMGEFNDKCEYTIPEGTTYLTVAIGSVEGNLAASAVSASYYNKPEDAAILSQINNGLLTIPVASQSDVVKLVITYGEPQMVALNFHNEKDEYAQFALDFDEYGDIVNPSITEPVGTIIRLCVENETETHFLKDGKECEVMSESDDTYTYYSFGVDEADAYDIWIGTEPYFVLEQKRCHHIC